MLGSSCKEWIVIKIFIHKGGERYLMIVVSKAGNYFKHSNRLEITYIL